MTTLFRNVAFLSLALIGTAATLFPPLPPGAIVPIVLAFDYPTNAMDTNLVFFIHGTAQVNSSLTNWPVEATLYATNYWTNGWNLPVRETNFTFTVNVNAAPGAHFYYATASNFWGESSDFSNVLAIPPLPVSTSGLNAKRGW